MSVFGTYEMSWRRAGLLKISMTAFGLAVGATWPEAFRGWAPWLWLTFALTAACLLAVFRPRIMRRRRKQRA